MGNITAVVALTENRVIGRDGGLPWPRLPADLKHLRACSIGRPNIMGRKVFDSLGGRPLKGRSNIVLTRQEDYAPAGVLVAHSPEEALELAYAQPEWQRSGEVVILGGEQIYKLYLSALSRIEQTIVHATLEGDTFFPTPLGEWEVVNERYHPKDEHHQYALTFQTLVRRG